jgi:hypothetical protein
MYPRSFLKTFDQPTQHLIRLMIGGKGPETAKPHKMTDFLLTSRWRPKQVHIDALHEEGFVLNKYTCNNALEDIEQLYKELVVPPRDYSVLNDNHASDEYTPFYWSSGLIMHPQLAAKTFSYIVKHNLQNAHSISYIHWFGTSEIFAASMKAVSQFSRGQMYCGINLNLYRNPSAGLVMSSMNLFNPHVANFQQMPWMINLNGVPMFSKCGPQKISIASIKIPFEVNNIHGPAVQQDGNTLLVTYITPPFLVDTANLYSNLDSRVFWPSQFLTSIGTVPMGASFGSMKKQGESDFDLSLPYQWIIGQRNQICVGILCTQAVKLDTSLTVGDTEDPPESEFTYLDASGVEQVTQIPRLVCSKRGHSWVIVVNTMKNIQDFVENKLKNILVIENRPGGSTRSTRSDKFKYDVTVTDSTAGSSLLSYAKEM